MHLFTQIFLSSPEHSDKMFRSTDLVFELVGVLVLRLVEVNEVVCDPVSASAVHVPADSKRITGDVTDPDLLRDREVIHIPKASVCRLCTWTKQHTGGVSSTYRLMSFTKELQDHQDGLFVVGRVVYGCQ